MSRTVILAVATSLLAAACSSGDDRTRVTLSMAGDPAEVESYHTLERAFEEANVGIDLVIDASPSAGDQMAKLATSFSGGIPPDLFLLNYRRFGQFASRNVLEPLGARLRTGTLAEDDFYPQALDAFRFAGTLQCLPTNISSLVVYYNEQLFAAAGVKAPAPGWRWEDLVATAKALTSDTDGDGKTDVYGLGIEPALVRLAPFVWQGGAEVVDDTSRPTRSALLDDDAIRAVTFFINLRREHKVVPSHEEAESEDMETRFEGGRLGMLVESRRITPDLRGVPDLEWDVAPLPSDRMRSTMLHSDAFCMAKSSTAKDAAYRFVEYALGAEGAAVLARTGRTVPSVRAVAESEAFLDPTQEPEHARVFLDQIPIIRRFPNITTWNEIETKSDPIVEEWFYGLEPPEALGVEIDIATRALFTEAS